MADHLVVNLSGYRFVALDELAARRSALQLALEATEVRGTVLLAAEGVNVALAGNRAACEAARAVFDADPPLADLWLKESRSATLPFARLKVRVREEIIAFEGAEAAARRRSHPSAPALAPERLRRWLDEGRELTLLDTRNAYEVDSGTFAAATRLELERFRDFGDAALAAVADGRLDPDRPVVTFCTGGVRCEKAAPWLLAHGFREVWQIEGGVLNWFERCGDAYWEGSCFVFDERVEIDGTLVPTGAMLCAGCQRAVPPDSTCRCEGSDRDTRRRLGRSAAQGSRTAIDTV